MKDIVTLLAAAEHLRASGEEGVLVTLVHTSGSTYRRPGARMLVLPGCRTVGTISGGCLERAVAKEAWDRTRKDARVCFSFESGPEDDTWGPASGCHGVLYLQAERIGAGERHTALEALAQVRAMHRPALVAHYFVLGAADELKPVGGWGGQTDSRWNGEEQITLANATSRWVEHDGIAAFLECLQPPTHLLICGAGDDAQPLERIATELAWSVDVIDTRGRLATRERFSRAEQVIAASPDHVAMLVHPHTAAVLMSHRFADDLEFLGQLLNAETSPAYIGLLGPRRRADRLLEELTQRGVRPAAKQSAALRSPIGLDLGSNSPETIALAIVAEIQATMAQRDARPLSNRVGPIHGPMESRPAVQASARRAGECAI